MNRRGHLSSKIPNVKLRPAPAGSSASARTRGLRRSPSPLSGMDAVINRREMEGEEDEDLSTAALRNVDRPWKEVVITFTGVEQKNRLGGLAQELGATVESALTVHVTHVVAIGFGSDKYHYAVEHRLPILTPAWIEGNHERWLAGHNVDPSIDAYRLLPFAGTCISISGIDDLERRKTIIAAIKSFGGSYYKNLDRSCTHLISAKPTSESKSSEKVQWAIKELRERDLSRRRGKKVEGHDIKICYEEWIWDCVAFCGRFQEDRYDARKPRPEGKVRAEDVLNGTVNFDDERSPAVEKVEAGEKDDGPAVVRKRKREDIDSLVGDLISTTVARVEAGDDGRTPRGLGLDSPGSGPTRLVPTSSTSHELRKASLLHATRTASFGPSKSLNPEATPSMPATAPQPPTGDVFKPRGGVTQMFSGLRFSHLIDEAYEGMERALVAHGGTIITEDARLQGQQVDMVIVRLASPRVPIPVDGVLAPTIVTECWVEGCCFEQRLLPTDRHLVFQPLPSSMPIPGTSSFSIHLSGFSTENLTYLRRLIRVIGATQAVSLNRQTTHLVSGKKDGPKVTKSREWGIKVVSDAWLLAMGRSGRVEPEADYPVDSTSTTTVTDGDGDAGGNDQSAPGLKVTSQATSQARALKLTPTHVDDRLGGLSAHTSASHSGFSEGSSNSVSANVNPLSPPQGVSARKLNQALPTEGSAHTRDRTSVSTREESVGSKSARPAAGAGVGAGAGEESIGTAGRNREMTDVLRQLAEKGDSSSSRLKAPRRSKAGLRARTSLAHRSATPVSPDKDPRSPERGHEHEQEQASGPMYEESMRVSIADPAAERERKKMMDALRKTSQLSGQSGRRPR